jgi:hypothetical protein
MITLSTLFILLYSYSVYKIRKDCKSWEDFNPFDSNIFSYAIFMFGTAILILSILLLVGYMVAHNIIP